MKKNFAPNGRKLHRQSQFMSQNPIDLTFNHTPSLHVKNKQLAKQLDKAHSLNLYHNLDFLHLDASSLNSNGESCAAHSSDCSSNGTVKSSAEYISDHGTDIGNNIKKNYIRSNSERLSEGLPLSSVLPLSYSASVEDNELSTPSSSIATRSPPSSRTNTFSSISSLSRSFSVASPCHYDVVPRRKRLTLFGRRHFDVMSASSPATQPSSPASSNDVNIPSPARFTSIYHAARKGIGEHISVNTAELNVLQVRKRDAGSLNAGLTYDADKLITHLERVVKKLQYQQTQLDELHEAYTLQQRYREGAYKLKSALNSSRVSSRTSLLGIKADLSRCTETLYTLEQELTSLLGRFHIEMKGLLGFARLRAGDQYEVVVRYGSQKWRMKGSVKSSGEQTWDNTQRTLQPLLSDLINIKVMEIKLLGKHSTVGNISCETKDLFKVEPQDVLANLNDTATLKLNLKINWSPYDGYESPPNANASTASTFLPDTSRVRSKSVMERPVPNYAASRNRLSSAFARPLSVIYQPSANTNNSNNRGTVEISKPIRPANDVTENSSTSSMDENGNKKRNNSHVQDINPSAELLESNQVEEEAFMAAISKNVQMTTSVNHEHTANKFVEEETVSVRAHTDHEISISRALVTAAYNVNVVLDDYRGRYSELKRFEIALVRLFKILKVDDDARVEADGFAIIDDSSDMRITKCFESGPIPTTGKLICDEALIPHLHLAQRIFKRVGVYGPLKVRQMVALDRLQQQGRVLERVLDIAASDRDVSLDEMEEFHGRRALLEMWRSSCDGNTSFCVSAKILRLELMSEFGREVRSRHSDVADKVFPELVRRIVDRPDITDVDRETVTLFRLSNYVNDTSDGENESFEKLVEKLALEMFITSLLSSGIHHLILVAIERISSLLALRLSNLLALSHLLLDDNRAISTAAAAHIKHIATERLLRDKATLAYAELLESESKRDRQCACIALGFLSSNKCIPQLAYLYHSDVEFDVREAASNVLLSMGEEGKAARDHASSTLLAQTMTQQVSLKNDSSRMGTAL